MMCFQFQCPALLFPFIFLPNQLTWFSRIPSLQKSAFSLYHTSEIVSFVFFTCQRLGWCPVLKHFNLNTAGSIQMFILMFFRYQLHMVSDFMLHQVCNVIISIYITKVSSKISSADEPNNKKKIYMEKLKTFFYLLTFGKYIHITSTFSLVCWTSIRNSAYGYFSEYEKGKGKKHTQKLISDYYTFSNEDCNILPAKRNLLLQIYRYEMSQNCYTDF